MDDTSGPVRDATAEALGTLLKVMGERPLNPYIEQLDKIKMDKVTGMLCCYKNSYLPSCSKNSHCYVWCYIVGFATAWAMLWNFFLL